MGWGEWGCWLWFGVDQVTSRVKLWPKGKVGLREVRGSCLNLFDHHVPNVRAFPRDPTHSDVSVMVLSEGGGRRPSTSLQWNRAASVEGREAYARAPIFLCVVHPSLFCCALDPCSSRPSFFCLKVACQPAGGYEHQDLCTSKKGEFRAPLCLGVLATYP